MSLYKTIADGLLERINTGVYKPGQKIPSIRQIAVEFGCNKITVQKAFEILKRDGIIENIVGSGSYVRFPEKISRTEAIFDFRTAYISETFFPHAKARLIFDGIFASLKASAFSPAPVEGDPRLIQYLAEFYQVPSTRMLIISGAQQGLDLIAKVFAAGISESILFEDPTYPGAISLFRARHFIPLDGEGPDMDVLDRKLKGRIKLFYTMPQVHNPTGRSYSLKRKEAVVSKARKGSFYIIEDDYLSEFRPDPFPRFVDLAPEQTIYIKSLSQTTVADIRLGFMVVPKPLYDKFVYAKFSSDIGSGGLMQRFMRTLIHSGVYRDYIDATKGRIQKRKKRLEALIASMRGLNMHGPQWGYSLWIESATPLDLIHVPWSRGEDFSFDPKYKNHFKISFMHMDDETFEKGLVYLEELFRRMAGG
jgi:DNA-binding transcriptional MocR family regulator